MTHTIFTKIEFTSTRYEKQCSLQISQNTVAVHELAWTDGDEPLVCWSETETHVDLTRRSPWKNSYTNQQPCGVQLYIPRVSGQQNYQNVTYQGEDTRENTQLRRHQSWRERQARSCLGDQNTLPMKASDAPTKKKHKDWCIHMHNANVIPLLHRKSSQY